MNLIQFYVTLHRFFKDNFLISWNPSTFIETKEIAEVAECESSPEIEVLDDVGMATQKSHDSDASDGLSQDTLELPGNGEGEESTDINPPKSPPPPNMRGLYWKVVREAQGRIRKENPDMKPKEILKLAREEWLGSIDRWNFKLFECQKLPTLRISLHFSSFQ